MTTRASSTLRAISLAALAIINSGNALAEADMFANATVITGTHYISPEVSLLGFTTEAGEPDIASGFGGATAWWRWTAPENGFCTVGSLHVPLNNPLEDPRVGVFTGATVSTLTQVATNSYSWKSGDTYNRALCTFYAVKDTTYHIVIDCSDLPDVTASANSVILNLGLLPLRATRKYAAGYVSGNGEIHYSASLNKTGTFAFSARVKVGRISYPLRGLLSPDGFFMSALSRPTPAGSPPVPPFGLLLDAKDGGKIYLGTGANAGVSAELFETKSFPKGTATPLAGKYTSAIGSILYVRVRANGTITGSGRAPDAVPYTFSGVLCASLVEALTSNARTPVVVSLHGGKGFVFHELRFQEAGVSDLLTSASRYIRPPTTGSYYPAGMNADLSITAGVRTYIPPASNQRALGFLEPLGIGKLVLDPVPGELAVKIEENLTFTLSNRFQFASQASKPSLKLNLSTGTASGSVLDSTGRKRLLHGAIHLRHDFVPALAGFATGTTQTVPLEVK